MGCAKAFLSVEMNMGQMVDDVRLAVNGRVPVEFFGRTGGIIPVSYTHLDRALDTPEDIFRETRDALQISTYELIFLGKEAHAAVDQGVEMVKSFSPGPAARVANAVLHLSLIHLCVGLRRHDRLHRQRLLAACHRRVRRIHLGRSGGAVGCVACGWRWR